MQEEQRPAETVTTKTLVAQLPFTVMSHQRAENLWIATTLEYEIDAFGATQESAEAGLIHGIEHIWENMVRYIGMLQHGDAQ